MSDEPLLKRIGGLYSKAFVAMVAKELAEARQVVVDGLASKTMAAKRETEPICNGSNGSRRK